MPGIIKANLKILMPNLSISTYIHLALAAIILALGVYCKILKVENSALDSRITLLTNSIQIKITALKDCSDATQAVLDKEALNTKNAKIAVAEAKKNAVVDYTAATQVLVAKPKSPVVTKDNAKDFGGLDDMIKEKDYLATQQLINDAIDARATK